MIHAQPTMDRAMTDFSGGFSRRLNHPVKPLLLACEE